MMGAMGASSPEGTTETVVIDLDPVTGPRPLPGPQLPARMRRGLVAALTSMLCLLSLAASAARAPTVLGRPLWTATVSLNGFTLGTHNLYEATTDARTVVGRDLATGKPRWSLGIDSADLPDSTTDVGHGVAAVVTRRLAQQPDRPVYSVTFVREGTGATIGWTRGYFFGPGADGAPLVIFSDRGTGPADCWPARLSCVDVTAWDVGTATVRWRHHLPPGTVALPSYRTDGRIDGLVEVADDGTVRLRDVHTGSVTGTVRISAAYLAEGQVLLTGEALLTALRAEETIVVSAYRRPGLDHAWSVTVPAPITPVSQDALFRGGIQLNDCGAGYVCLHPDQLTARIIANGTGLVSRPLPYLVVLGVGHGLFVAGRPSEDAPSAVRNGHVVDHTGRILATLTDVNLVPWDDSGGRTIVIREGRAGTEFITYDARGGERSLGTVAGTGLSCRARGRYLSCSDRAGALRTWRMPAWATTALS
jgi:hypothetical protein